VHDVGGQPIGAPTGFHIGVSVNPAASNIDEELRRFEYKVEAGAEFVVTRPVFDLRCFEQVLRRLEPAKLPVVAGLFPFESARNAEFMANEVPGVRVPEALLDRMRAADGPEAAIREGIAIAREIAAQLRIRFRAFTSRRVRATSTRRWRRRWTTLTNRM
jgi:homocysteine S-methyltransferase